MLHRRHFLQGLTAGGVALISGELGAPPSALAQTPPSGCPPAPVNGKPFRPGQDTRPILPRKSISALSTAEIAQLRTAFAKLRALPASDNRSWVIQADMHALFCSGCNHDRIQSVHGSWIFFPWHRAYLYYFERILGSLVGDIKNFRLPFWDWENHRFLPEIYAIPAHSSNSLYDANRYAAINQGANLPSKDGTVSRIALLDGIHDFATFGGTRTSGGACESNPHDPIHDDIGLHTSPNHDMGNLGFAARDPIFYSHHANLDKIWSKWNALAGAPNVPSGAYKNPTDPTLLDERWNFYDENKNVVSITAGQVMNHQTNLRYSYASSTAQTSSSTSPEASPETAFSGPVVRAAPAVSTYSARLIDSSSGLRPGLALDVTYGVKVSVLQAVAEQSSVAVILRGVTVPDDAAGVFDIMSVRGSNMKQLGTIAIVNDSMRMSTLPKTVLLDATEAVAELLETSNPAKLELIPREGNTTFKLHAEDIDLRVVSRP